MFEFDQSVQTKVVFQENDIITKFKGEVVLGKKRWKHHGKVGHKARAVHMEDYLDAVT